jgi:hypothetical protein
VSLATFDPRQLELFTRQFEELFYAGDPASMISYYTEDTRSWPTAGRCGGSATLWRAGGELHC